MYFFHTCISRNSCALCFFLHTITSVCVCGVILCKDESVRVFHAFIYPTYVFVYLHALYRVSHCGNQFVSCTMKNHPHLGIGRSLSLFSSSADTTSLRTNTNDDSHHRAIYHLLVEAIPCIPHVIY